MAQKVELTEILVAPVHIHSLLITLRSADILRLLNPGGRSCCLRALLAVLGIQEVNWDSIDRWYIFVLIHLNLIFLT